MRLQSLLISLLASISTVTSSALPNLDRALSRRDLEFTAELVPAQLTERSEAAILSELEKRRGGGGSSGGGGGGGGGGRSSGGSSSSSGSSGSGTSGSRGYVKHSFIVANTKPNTVPALPAVVAALARASRPVTAEANTTVEDPRDLIPLAHALLVESRHSFSPVQHLPYSLACGYMVHMRTITITHTPTATEQATGTSRFQ